MNKERRKELNKLATALRELHDKVQDFSVMIDSEEKLVGDVLEDYKTDINDIRDAEQEYYDNMPEGLQNGEKGEAASNAVSELEGAAESLEEAVTSLGEILEKLDDAASRIEEVSSN